MKTVRMMTMSIRVFKSRKNDHSNNSSKKLLIIFINAIGDFVLFSSILPKLRQYYTDHKITLLGFDRWKDLVHDSPYIDEYIEFDRYKFYRNLFHQFKIIRLLKSQKFDILLYPPPTRSLIGDEIVKSIAAPISIGFSSVPGSKGSSRKGETAFSNLITTPSHITKEIDFYSYLSNDLTGIQTDSQLPSISFSEKIGEEARNILMEAGIAKNERFVVIAPGAASTDRLWPVKKFAAICDQLKAQDYKVVLIGSNSDAQLGKRLLSLTEGSVQNLMGRTNLRQSAAICSMAEFFIGNESGPLHIALASGCPTVGIMGGGYPFRFYPYGNLEENRPVYNKMSCYECAWNCIHPSVLCIEDISVEQVLGEIMKLRKVLKK
jgi:ADP-heptose:LPS heptosyltransferase